MIVAICVFCKWVELGLLKDLSSASVRDWFHENIVCRYGVPAAVRCDRGAEFRGEFESYCKCNGIQIHCIATRNPRANGQIERYNQTIERMLRKFAEQAAWWNMLQDVARALRLLPVRASGYAPFVLAFKQLPQLPLEGALRAMSVEEVAEWGD